MRIARDGVRKVDGYGDMVMLTNMVAIISYYVVISNYISRYSITLKMVESLRVPLEIHVFMHI
jgi:hypothetical protein